MLHFMYRFDYDGSGNDQGRVSPMLFNVKVYGIADKYEIWALQLLAEKKFAKAVRTCWDMDDFAHVVSEIYSSTPSTDRGLRDIVVDIAHENIEALLEKDDFLGVLEGTAGFAADVTQLLAQKKRLSNRKYKCPYCANEWEAVLSSGRTYYCLLCGQARSDWQNHLKQ
jgi:hypothetical protein